MISMVALHCRSAPKNVFITSRREQSALDEVAKDVGRQLPMFALLDRRRAELQADTERDDEEHLQAGDQERLWP